MRNPIGGSYIQPWTFPVCRPDAVDSFVILAPSNARFDAALREVESFLKGCFPEYDFLANGESTPFDGDYEVLPICGFGGDDPGTLRVLDYPEQSVMMGIAAALKGFRPGMPPSLN
ncbi:hypothetical protein NKH24_06995 [Mesorhizobium sp. M1300]|uniref:hypothetical protein n=1 Tax=Mesorhizobium sp. M1300 TaxID=2957077 RepID=UPI0033370684